MKTVAITMNRALREKTCTLNKIFTTSHPTDRRQNTNQFEENRGVFMRRSRCPQGREGGIFKRICCTSNRSGHTITSMSEIVNEKGLDLMDRNVIAWLPGVRCGLLLGFLFLRRLRGYRILRLLLKLRPRRSRAKAEWSGGTKNNMRNHQA